MIIVYIFSRLIVSCIIVMEFDWGVGIVDVVFLVVLCVFIFGVYGCVLGLMFIGWELLVFWYWFSGY